MILDFLKAKKRVEDTPTVDTEVSPPEKKEKPAHTFYRLGYTDTNRVSFNMGYSEFTMDREGCNQLINAVTVFRDMLPMDKDEQDE